MIKIDEAHAAACEAMTVAFYAVERFERAHARDLSRAVCARSGGDHATWAHAMGGEESAESREALRKAWEVYLPLLTELDTLKDAAGAAFYKVHVLTEKTRARFAVR